MNFPDYSSLKQQSRQALARSSHDPRRLVLLHSCMSFLFLLLVTAWDYLLGQSIDSTGGLGGIELRSLLSTIQFLLFAVQLLLIPLWQLGYQSALLRIASGKEATASTLLDGFRNAGPAIRLTLLRSVIYIGIAFFASYASLFVFFATPVGSQILQQLAPMLDSSAAVDPDQLAEIISANIADNSLFFLAIFGLLYALIGLPIFYRFRMADFALLEQPNRGALAALRSSYRTMRGNCIGLLKIDLHFWWFYLLDIGILVLGNADLLASTAGLHLPISDTASYFLFFILSQICAIVLYWWRRNEVTTVYVMAYQNLQTPQQKADLQKVPWNY